MNSPAQITNKKIHAEIKLAGNMLKLCPCSHALKNIVKIMNNKQVEFTRVVLQNSLEQPTSKSLFGGW